MSISVREACVDRRQFLVTAGAATLAAHSLSGWARAAESSAKAAPETLVKTLYDSLTEAQRKVMCHDWDYQHADFGLLRTFVANNWQVNAHPLTSGFYTTDQQDIVRAIFEGIYNPEWHKKIEKQLQDDAGGYGKEQCIAIFGKPGDGKFQFLMTGRHMTVRCDGNSEDHVAIGGPVFYGHAAESFNETADHPGNVYWEQALVANKLYQMLDGRQQTLALVAQRPDEAAVGFQGSDGKFPGIPASELSSDQREHLQMVLKKLVEPYRHSDQAEVLKCLEAQGGLEKCSLAFYKDGDIGSDGVWDNWRLEGPSFVWYFRGEPHVHVWVNVADDPSPKLNAAG
jgi:hypothetical protein